MQARHRLAWGLPRTAAIRSPTTEDSRPGSRIGEQAPLRPKTKDAWLSRVVPDQPPENVHPAARRSNTRMRRSKHSDMDAKLARRQLIHAPGAQVIGGEPSEAVGSAPEEPRDRVRTKLVTESVRCRGLAGKDAGDRVSCWG